MKQQRWSRCIIQSHTHMAKLSLAGKIRRKTTLHVHCYIWYTSNLSMRTVKLGYLTSIFFLHIWEKWPRILIHNVLIQSFRHQCHHSLILKHIDDWLTNSDKVKIQYKGIWDELFPIFWKEYQTTSRRCGIFIFKKQSSKKAINKYMYKKYCDS